MTRNLRIYEDQCLKNIDKLIELVGQENERQLEKWDVQQATSFEWMLYLTEEIGELAQAINEFEYREGNAEDIVNEAIQSATLCLKIAEMFNIVK
jgi:NTP pyrophosphatase (non-canonical NTP hydrolase)